MCENQDQNNDNIQEGQWIPKTQKIIPTDNIEKGQPIPPMQQKPQTQQPQPTQDQGGESSEGNK